MIIVSVVGISVLFMFLVVILLAFIAFPVLKKVVGGLIVILVLFWVVVYTITADQKRREMSAQTYRPVVTDVTDTALLFREHETRSQPAPIPLPRPRPNREAVR